MLSKSAARAFFLAGTALCTLAFLGLTVDTFGRIPAQTHADALSPAAIRGKHLWEESNCMGCHTLLGEGAYYAPELTRVIDRRGEAFVRAMLRDPEAMYPGQRRMQNYGFSEAEIDDLVAFLTWVNGMDLNGFPPEPVLPGFKPSVSEGRPAVFDQVCTACHAVGDRGGRVGPALDGVATRYDEAYLRRWLADPQAVKPGTTMPKLVLNEAQIDGLVTYLLTLDEGN